MSETPFRGARFYENIWSPLGIVFLHAYTGTPNDFNMVASYLQRVDGLEILSPLFKGHGSDNVFDLFEANPADWEAEAKAAVAWMQARHETVLVFGLSMGGIITTSLLTQNEGFITAGGVFNSPVITKKPTDVSYFFEEYAQDIYQRNGRAAQYKEDHEALMEGHFAQMRDLHNYKQSFHKDLKNIDVPYFLAQSGADEMIVADDWELLKGALTNADVEAHWYPNNTHVITVNRDREEFVEDLSQFIRKFT